MRRWEILFSKDMINNLRHKKYQEDFKRKNYVKKMEQIGRFSRFITKFRSMFFKNNEFEPDNLTDKKFKNVVDGFKSSKKLAKNQKNKRLIRDEKDKDIYKEKEKEEDKLSNYIFDDYKKKDRDDVNILYTNSNHKKVNSIINNNNYNKSKCSEIHSFDYNKNENDLINENLSCNLKPQISKNIKNDNIINNNKLVNKNQIENDNQIYAINDDYKNLRFENENEKENHKENILNNKLNCNNINITDNLTNKLKNNINNDKEEFKEDMINSNSNLIKNFNNDNDNDNEKILNNGDKFFSIVKSEKEISMS
jgi:hypothetical protein